MIPSPSGSARLVHTGPAADIEVTRNNRTLLMLGEAGPRRELAFLPKPGNGDSLSPMPMNGPFPAPPANLPVLIGSGVGAALAELVRQLESAHGPDFPLAIVDKEADILAITGLQQRFAHHPGIVWITASDVQTVLNDLTALQEKHHGLSLHALANPFYLRLDRPFYSAIQQACAASEKAGFWEHTRYPRFQSTLPRILLLTSKYFLMGEIISACERLGVPHYFLQVPDGELGKIEFVEGFLSAVIEFKPDFVFTINHLGVDREGILTDLLEKLRLPLASWFVDNPHLVLHLYSRLISPWAALFTWDADNITSLSAMGFPHVSYLSLGTDVTRFIPSACAAPPGLPPIRRGQPAESWKAYVSFVGNSMVSKVSLRMERGAFPPALLASYQEVAAGFAASDERAVRRYLEIAHPALLPHFDSLETTEQQLAYETTLTWEATRQYRLACVQATLPFAPLIVGDAGWKTLLSSPAPWHYHSELNYYADLPRFYPCSDINFNCTSKQMKGAVNQRVFDVPATNSFLITDYREQIENLFDPGAEVVCFHSPEEATDLIRYYLARPNARSTITQAARKRVLAHHSYEHRVQTLIAKMREIYG